jgi:hypothetical protein
MSKIIDHKSVAKAVIAACDEHKLTCDEAVKCLIYTGTKLLTKELATTDEAAAQVLSKAALSFRDEIRRINRMFANRG